ncbi:hypothetical protein ABZ716_07215 [Streptomyces sp. NPDC006687]|uniref:hypothetical protein n=1 Tax=unclassified Streptomyces TaxID=2593676 RepID=UPI0033C2C2DB
MPAAALGTRAVAEAAHHPDAARVGVLTELAILTWGVFLASHGYGGAYRRGTKDPAAGVISSARGGRLGTLFLVDDTEEEAP